MGDIFQYQFRNTTIPNPRAEDSDKTRLRSLPFTFGSPAYGTAVAYHDEGHVDMVTVGRGSYNSAQPNSWRHYSVYPELSRQNVTAAWGTNGGDHCSVHVTDMDKQANLTVKLSRDDMGQAELEIDNPARLEKAGSDGADVEISNDLRIPLGDVTDADARFFDDGFFAVDKPIKQVDVHTSGGQTKISFNNEKQPFIILGGEHGPITESDDSRNHTITE